MQLLRQSQLYGPSSFGGEGRRQEQGAIDVPEEQGGQASSSFSLGASTPPFAPQVADTMDFDVEPAQGSKHRSEETAQQGERKAIRLDETPVENPKRRC